MTRVGESVAFGDGDRISISLEARNELLDAWALAIGRFMVTFASCEYWTYLYVQTFGSDRLREVVADMSLASRAKLARALASEIGLNAATQTRIDRAFGELEKLSGTRNLVAHNGPMVHVYVQKETGEIKVEHVLRSARDPGRDITIAELEKRYAEVSALDEEFALLYGDIRQPVNRAK